MKGDRKMTEIRPEDFSLHSEVGMSPSADSEGWALAGGLDEHGKALGPYLRAKRVGCKQRQAKGA